MDKFPRCVGLMAGGAIVLGSIGSIVSGANPIIFVWAALGAFFGLALGVIYEN